MDTVLREICEADSRSLATGGGLGRIFSKLCDIGALRKIGPTRVATPLRNLEMPRTGGQEAWQLFALFDCVIAWGLSSVVVDYILQVCQDAFAVSSDPVEAILMDQRLIEMWCEELGQYLRREFHSTLETIDVLDQQFLDKIGWLKQISLNLSSILEVVIPDKDVKDVKSSIQCCAENTSQLLVLCSLCQWCSSVGLMQLPPYGKYGSMESWQQSISDRCIKAKSTLFIVEMLTSLGVPIESYPFSSSMDAVRKIFFVSTRQAEGFLQTQIKTFLYYIIDMDCLNIESLGFLDYFEITHAESSAIRAYVQLDSLEDQNIDKACESLPSVTSVIDSTKVVEVLLSLDRPLKALDVIRANVQKHFPDLGNALSTLNVYLSCRGFHEAYLYSHQLWTKSHNDDHKNVAKKITESLCEWSYNNGHMALLFELPFLGDEQKTVENYLQGKRSTGKLRAALIWPTYLTACRRYIEADIAYNAINMETFNSQNQQSMEYEQEIQAYEHLRELIKSALKALPSPQRSIQCSFVQSEEKFEVHEGLKILSREAVQNRMKGSKLQGNDAEHILIPVPSTLGRAPLSSKLSL